MRGDGSLGGSPSGDPGTTLGQHGAKVPAQCPGLLTSPVAGHVRHHSALHGRVCPGPADTQPPSLMGVTRRGRRSPRWEQRIPLSRRGSEVLRRLRPSPAEDAAAPLSRQGLLPGLSRGRCLPHRPQSGAGSAPWGGLRLQRSRERQALPSGPFPRPHTGALSGPHLRCLSRAQQPRS